MALDLIIWHDGDAGLATALAHRLGEELREGDTLLIRDVSEGATLDPAVPTGASVVHAGEAPGEADVVLVVAADVTPDAGLVDALRRGPKEFEAWSGILLDPHGGSVAAAGFDLAFTARTLPSRPGLAVERLPETEFLSAAVPAELFAVRRQAIAELGALEPADTPAGAALDLSLRLRASGARAGVMPAARVRIATQRPLEAGIEDRIPSVVRAYPTPVLAVASPALALAGPAAIASGVMSGDGREALGSYRAGLAAGRAAARERAGMGALRSLDSAGFSDGLGVAGADARTPTRLVARAWWGAAASALRLRRARHRRQAARQT